MCCSRSHDRSFLVLSPRILGERWSLKAFVFLLVCDSRPVGLNQFKSPTDNGPRIIDLHPCCLPGSYAHKSSAWEGAAVPLLPRPKKRCCLGFAWPQQTTRSNTSFLFHSQSSTACRFDAESDNANLCSDSGAVVIGRGIRRVEPARLWQCSVHIQTQSSKRPSPILQITDPGLESFQTRLTLGKCEYGHPKNPPR